jgi:hypothetical protein
MVLDDIQGNVTTLASTVTGIPSPEDYKVAETQLENCRRALAKVTRSDKTVIERKETITRNLNNIAGRLSELSHLISQDQTPIPYYTGKLFCFLIYNELHSYEYVYQDHLFRNDLYRLNRISQIAIFIGVVCTVTMGISRRDGDFVMGLLNMLVYLAFSLSGKPTALAGAVLKEIPLSIRGALSKLDLESRTIIYAVCPACHCTYEPKYTPGEELPRYPQRCTNIPHPEAEICGEQLLRDFDDEDSLQGGKPIKPFVYHDFRDYIAGLLSRADLEGMMDKSCRDLLDANDKNWPESVRDIWEAEFLRTFEGPFPKKLFVDGGDEGRFVFTLNIDFFNIEGMRIRGASTSCGLISLVCLNLAPEIRYKPENMYVCIIPGPKEPSRTELNHYMRPVVNHFVEGWDQGIYFSRTALRPHGRQARYAIAAAVMDLRAARQASGLSQPNGHHHCSVCQCCGKESLGSTDWKDWRPRDHRELRKQAENWRISSTMKDQETIFNTYGTRYSELYRLSYWNPTRQVVVDCMHCVLEGNAQDHFRNILDLSTKSAENKLVISPAFEHKFSMGPHPDDMTTKEIKQVEQIHTLLTLSIDGVDRAGDIIDQLAFDQSFENLRKRLQSKNLKPLTFVCKDLRLNAGPYHTAKRIAKEHWVKALVQWVGDFSLMC